MKKRVIVFFACMLLVCSLLPATALADSGPKPSVRITFQNMGDEPCYGTLLSKETSTGPASAWDGKAYNIYNDQKDGGREVWSAFVEYEDADGFYFLQQWWSCSEKKVLNWTYYPPDTFKILLYYPETGRFISSGIYEKYAFDSYYTVDLSGAESGVLTAEKSYDYTNEAISFVCRVIITILLEIGVALLFGFSQKKLLRFIIIVNCVTQIVLNLSLNNIYYQSGAFQFVFYYFVFELGIFIIEALLYWVFFNRVSTRWIGTGKMVAYSLVSNTCSLVGGLAIAKILPGIF